MKKLVSFLDIKYGVLKISKEISILSGLLGILKKCGDTEIVRKRCRIYEVVLKFLGISLAPQTVRNCSFVEEIIKHARYFPHSHEYTIPLQKFVANGEDSAEESFVRVTLLSKILIVCGGLHVLAIYFYFLYE